MIAVPAVVPFAPGYAGAEIVAPSVARIAADAPVKANRRFWSGLLVFEQFA
jgi:hypothetical protein